MTVSVVTDSSAGLPADLVARWRIRRVSLHILVDGTDLREGVDQIPDDIWQRDRASTAGASPDELAGAYTEALAAADGGVLAVHISAALSGTLRAAQVAAANLGSAVRVVDSRSTAMGTGFVALAAAKAAADGAGLDEVVRAAEAAVRRVRAYVVVRRLDNLRRSGRIGGAAAWLGTALSMKPLLRIDDGRLVLAQRVRTVGRATAAMIDRVCDEIGDRPAALAVQHVADPDGAAGVAAILAERLPSCAPAVVTDLGPVLSLHVGPGAIAVCADVGEPQ